MPHTGLETRLRFYAIAVKTVLYHVFCVSLGPKITKKQALTARNELIRARFACGEPMRDLAREYNISPQRVSQIIHERRR